ncbi:Fumarylacetoacetate hydrolase family protein [hydrothermal vent metagenome]|uniref:Fumarylacetoacetate hydrolase family protein n=1 Tax=hydrothermal vent metagenome TaxID=652676 RepID=A0A3B0TZC9_9ZZZZ
MKIICIGRNYVAHARELNNEIPTEPVVFMKPDSAILRNNDPFYIPGFSKNVHYEIELVVKIGRLGKNIEKRFAHRYYDEIGLGVDFTARDLQSELRAKGLPWEKAKAFDRSAVLGNIFLPKSRLPDINAVRFYLDINGKTVQKGNSSLMIFSIDTIIEHVSRFFTLKMGDLIYTGTPAGVGPVKIGDCLEGYLEGHKLLDFMIK